MTLVRDVPTVHAAAPDRAAAVAALAVIAAAAALRAAVPVDSNIGWLISVARAVLGGARLGSDIVETNPPMAVWIHLPAAAIEAATGLAAEPIFVALVFALAAAAAWRLAAAWTHAGLGRRYDLPIALAVFLLAPLATFGEREHVAPLLIVPAIATAIERGAGRRPSWPAIVVAGLAAGIAVTIKPQFAAPVAALALWQAVRLRTPRALFVPEAVLAAVVAVAVAAAVWHWLPSYVDDVLPVLFDLYRPARLDLPTLVTEIKMAKWLFGLVAFGYLTIRLATPAGSAALLAAATGFIVGYLDQGRGWTYQFFPGAALLMLAVLRRVPEGLAAPDRRARLATVAAAVVMLSTLPHFSRFIPPNTALVAAVRAALPRPHPTILAISADLTPGHPIATDLGARWAGTYSSRWITAYADVRHEMTSDPAALARADAWARHDRDVTNRDLAERRPDIVLVGLGPLGWPAWIAADPTTRRLMAGYRRVFAEPVPAIRRRIEPVEAWVRADLLAGPAP
jgi:hypothetical protein